ncbi:MAG: hypothetical protein RR332_00155 [Clostridiales bacterium]
MFTKTEDDIDLAFAAGENYATAELTIIRNVADNGAEFRAAYSSSDYILGGWLGRHKGIRKRGGRKSYVKLYPAKIIDMPDNMAVALLRLSPYVRADGYLSNGNGKRKAKNISEIFSLLRVSKTRG